MSPSTETCCSPTCCSRDSNATLDAVRDRYAAAARSGLSNDVAGVQAIAEAFGYTSEELRAIPAEANIGLSCGNPTATARLRPGEVVLDLGSGGGLDVFLAAQEVGPTGRAIGIDMTPEMIDRARRAAARGVDGKPIENVEFHLATIDKLPLPDCSVDVILSNCVINLAPDKRAVFREMHRVLRPGGRVAVSDIALKKPLPDEILRDVMAYVGCIAGAIGVGEYERGLREAGFADVAVLDSGRDLHAYSILDGQTACRSPAASGSSAVNEPATAGTRGRESNVSCCGAPSGHAPKATVHGHLSDLLERYDVNEYAASVRIYALKPAR